MLVALLTLLVSNASAQVPAEHLEAATIAAHRYESAWKTAGWQDINVPVLLVAIASNESNFRQVARYQGRTLSPRELRQIDGLADYGIMQIRAPSRPARRCGVKTAHDRERLVVDINYAYSVGACVLATHVRMYSQRYEQRRWQRLSPGQRPPGDLRYYASNPDARQLLVIERYNWGDSDLYLHSIAAGYARRIHQTYKQLLGDTLSAVFQV